MPAANKKSAPSPEPEAVSGTNVTVLAPAAENPDAIKAMTAFEYAQSLTVASAADSAKGQEASQRLNTAIKVLDDQRKDLTRPLDALKTKWMSFFGGPIDKYKAAKAIIDAKVIDYQKAQEELRKAEQRRLDKIAADEQARLQAIADEAKRKADAQAEQLRKEAEAAAAAGRAEEAAKLAAKAARVEEKAEAKAEVFESRASSVVAPIAQAETAKVAGSSFRDNWKWRVKDKTKINPTFLMTVPNDAAIDGIVKSLKGEAVSLVGEGIEIYNEKILASRRT